VDGELPIHPLANLFPEMTPAEFAGLKADVEAHGQRDPVWLYRGEIIDGKHRYRVCRELGRPVLVRDYTPAEGESPVRFVVSLNLHRRHLDSSQRAAVAVDMMPLLEAEAKERQRRGGSEGGKRSAESRQGKGKPKVGQTVDTPSTSNPPAGRATEQAAQLLGTNRQYIHDAKNLKDHAPTLFEQVRSGRKTVAEAKREHKADCERRKQIDNNRAKGVDDSLERRIAYHEAGHAVLAYILGGKITEITINTVLSLNHLHC
jgi:hypothetical protein